MIYKFIGRATGVDPEGYYYPRWDRAQSISVLAATKEEATQKAVNMLGDHPRFSSWRSGLSGWGIIWDSMEEVASK